jgi:hypothetical protein
MALTPSVAGQSHQIRGQPHSTPTQRRTSQSNTTFLGEVDQWLVSVQKGIRELEDRHKRHLESVSRWVVGGGVANTANGRHLGQGGELVTIIFSVIRVPNYIPIVPFISRFSTILWWGDR